MDLENMELKIARKFRIQESHLPLKARLRLFIKVEQKVLNEELFRERLVSMVRQTQPIHMD